MLKMYCFIQDILARLGQGEVIIGDGSYVVTLEKRGYVKAGDWTPEASVEVPYSSSSWNLQNTLVPGPRWSEAAGQGVRKSWGGRHPDFHLLLHG